MDGKIKTVLLFISLFLVTLALYAVFIYAPTEAFMGDVQRIFYFHVSYAWVSFLAFFVTFIGGIMYLASRKRWWDILAVSSAEIGVVFCLVVLTTGPIWAKPVWGAWWTWDPRLVTTLILWFIFVGYLMVRGAVDEETKRGRFSAVVGIIGFLNVPLVYISMVWFRTIHPNIREGAKLSLDPKMITALRFSVIAITCLYILLLLIRMDMERLRDRVSELKKKAIREA